MRPMRESRKQQQRELMVKTTRLLRAAARRETDGRQWVPPPLERCRPVGRTIFGSKIWLDHGAAAPPLSAKAT
jgi:hypothetical protein